MGRPEDGRVAIDGAPWERRAMRVLGRVKMPSPAMVVACLALVVALSGAAYAAANLPPNSVGTAQLKNGAVTNTKVVHEGLTLSDLGAAKPSDRATLGIPVTMPVSLAADSCVNWSPSGVVVRPSKGVKVFGAMVIGNLTNANGGPAVDGAVAIAPTLLIQQSGGGATVNLIVCNSSSTPETIPAGSVFHLRFIFP